MEKEVIELIVKAKHFDEEVQYYSSYDDPICRAAVEQLGAEDPDEYLSGIDFTINEQRKHYAHENYTIHMFNKDLEEARQLEFDETPIRRLILTETSISTKE